MRRIFLIFVLFLTTQTSFAETIKLKSGKIIEGRVTQLTFENIKIDTGLDVPITYYRDEIDSIDGKPMSPAPSEEKLKENVNESLNHYRKSIEGDKQFYETGELMSEGSMLNGAYRSYYKNGQVALDGNFKDGQPWNGHLTKYREDGGLESDHVYREGILLNENGQPYNGVVKTYFEDGNLRDEAPYKNGRRHGTSTTFHENGEMAAEIDWKDGKQDGYYKAYDESGSLTAKIKWKDGQIVFEKHDK